MGELHQVATSFKSIRVRSGLVALKRAVVRDFEARGIGASVTLGFKERTKQVNEGERGANRVVFSPCEDDGKGGEIEPPNGVGPRDIVDGNNVRVATIRALHDWSRVSIVRVWAVDDTDATDEELQIEATEALFEQVVRAIHNAVDENGVPLGFANVRPGKPKWTPSPVEQSFGRELSFELPFRHPLYDAPDEVIHRDFILQTDPPK